jgi:hypothetical protein
MAVDVRAHTNRRVVIELKALKEAGLLVDVDARGLYRFTLGVLLPELGLGPDAARAWGLKASRLLIPDRLHRRLRAAEQRARRALERHSLDLFRFGGYRYVPATAWEAFRAEFDEARAGVAAVRAEMLGGYDALKAFALKKAAQIAREAFRAAPIRRQHPDFEAFRKTLVARVEARFPSREELAEMDLYLKLGEALTVADLAEEEARLARAEAELYEARARIQAAREQAEAARREALAYARQRVKAELAPFDEYLAALRARIHGRAARLLDSVRRQGPQGLNPRTLKAVAELYETFRRLDLLGDQELEAELKRALEAAKSARPKTPRPSRPAPTPDAAAQALALALEAVVELCAPRTRAAALIL